MSLQSPLEVHGKHEGPRRFAPWLKIWVSPRATIRQYLDSSDPSRHMLVLALLGGIVNALNNASAENYLDKLPVGTLIFVVLLGGMISGVIGLYLGAFLLRWSGSWFGGTGTSEDIRVAITRGLYVPLLLTSFIWIPQLLLFGQEMFTYETPRIDSSALLTVLLLFLGLIELVFSVWSFIIFVKAVAEAHQFSAWKSLGSMLLPALILSAIVIIIVIIAIRVIVQ